VHEYVRRIRHFQGGTSLLLVNTLGSYTGYGVILLVYNLYLVALGYHEDFIGLFASVLAMATIAGSLGAIPICRRWGSGWCIVSGSIGVVVSSLGLSVAVGPAAILALGAINGFVMGQLFVPVGPYLVQHTTAEDRQDAFAVIWAAQSLSQALGSAIAGVLPAYFATAFALGAAEGVLPLRLTLLAGGALSALGLVPVVGLLQVSPRPSPDERSKAAADSPRPARSAPRLILLFGSVIFLTSLSAGFVLPFLNVYLADRLGATTAEVGLIFVVISGAMVVAQLGGPAVARRYGTVRSIWLGRLIVFPLMLSLVFVPSLVYTAFVVTVRGALVSMSWPLDNAFSLGLVGPRNAAQLTSTRSIAFSAGQTVSSLVAGLIIVGFGYPPTFALSAGCILLAGIIHFRSFRRDDPHPGWRGGRLRVEAGTEP
jgi:predicted MFS family arabinose efflux permease